MTDCNKEQLTLLCKEHLADVAKIEESSFAEPWSEKALSYLLTGDNFGVVLLLDGEAAAYGGVSVAIPDADITNVATLPLYRRRGYAKRVVLGLFDEAKKRGIESLYLEVRRSNVAAIALYESLGFFTVGERKNFYSAPREDAVLMKKEI